MTYSQKAPEGKHFSLDIREGEDTDVTVGEEMAIFSDKDFQQIILYFI